MMTRLPIVCLVLLVGLTAHAEDKKPGKGFWKILVKPKAAWVLHNTMADDAAGKAAKVTIETYDVRKVAGADVARLRWTHTHGIETQDIGGGVLMPTQVAVTAAGLYLLSAADDDAKITAALKKKPSRSDPPKPYAGTKQNQGRYLHVLDDMVCMGEGPTPDAGECADVCDAQVCFSATDGVVSMMGLAAPGYSVWEQ